MSGGLDCLNNVSDQLEAFLLILRVEVEMEDLLGCQSLDPQNVPAEEDGASDTFKVGRADLVREYEVVDQEGSRC